MCWEIEMKVTLDLPEDLVRQLYARAAKEGRTLDAVAEDVIRRGLDILRKKRLRDSLKDSSLPWRYKSGSE